MAIRIFHLNSIGRERAPLRRAPFQYQEAYSVTASPQQSAAFAPAAAYVTIQSDEACHVAFGENPTASTGDFKILAGETWDFDIDAGHKVSWIAA